MTEYSPTVLEARLKSIEFLNLCVKIGEYLKERATFVGAPEESPFSCRGSSKEGVEVYQLNNVSITLIADPFYLFGYLDFAQKRKKMEEVCFDLEGITKLVLIGKPREAKREIKRVKKAFPELKKLKKVVA